MRERIVSAAIAAAPGAEEEIMSAVTSSSSPYTYPAFDYALRPEAIQVVVSPEQPAP